MKPFHNVHNISFPKRGLIFSTIFFIGLSHATAQKLNPILVQRELNLPPAAKQRLAADRQILQLRKVKFVIGATEVSQRPVRAATGAIKHSVNASLFNSRLNKQYQLQELVTINTKFFSMLSRKLVTPIRNQGYCGSCWDFAIMACAETNYLMKYSKTEALAASLNLSEQQVLCNANAGSCNGGYSSGAAAWMYNKKVNLVTESSLPYNSKLPNLGNEAASCPQPSSSNRMTLYRVVDYGMVPIKAGKEYPDVNDIKQAILEHGAVTAAFWADSLVFAQIILKYGGGEYDEQEPLYTPKNYTPSPAGHEVAIVGWDDSIKCWIIKNSWGDTWGDDGYGLFRYGAHNIGTDATWVEVEIVKTFIPPIILK